MAELQDYSLPPIPAAPDTSTTHKHNDPSSATRTSSSSSTSSFFYKAILFVAAALLLHLFPSQAPEFIHQTLLTRSWELIHLLLVGIAVSYGLFSRKNPGPDADDKVASPSPEKQPAASSSYFSDMSLQVASVFDDENDSSLAVAGFDLDGCGRAQMWNSRYYMDAPTLVVTQGGSDNNNKPLCLPVRSLRSSQVLPPVDADEVPGGYLDDSSGLGMGRTGDLEGDGDVGRRHCPQLEEETSAAVMLPSPIPWRSRTSARSAEPKLAETSSRSIPTPPPPPRPSYLPPPAVDADLQGAFRTQSFRTRRPSGSRTPSPSPSPSPSPEPSPRAVEHVVRRRVTHNNKAPPPPPPPPPSHFGHRPQLYYSDKSQVQLRRSFTDELKHLSRSGGRETPPAPSPPPPSSTSPLLPTKKPAVPPRPPPVPSPKKEERRMAYTVDCVYRPPVPKKGEEEEEECRRKKRNGFSRRFVMDSDDDSDTEKDGASESSTDAEEEDDDDDDDAWRSETTAAEAGGNANEVDKKADEFIAKFREQIRLQRIDSIKRSTGHRSVKNSE